MAVETSTGSPTQSRLRLWENQVLYVVLGGAGLLLLALLLSPVLREALIQRIQNTPPAELVLWGSILFIVILLASTGSFLFRLSRSPLASWDTGRAYGVTLKPTATGCPRARERRNQSRPKRKRL